MGRIVLITGASRGVGRSLAEQMATRGDTVIGCGRTHAITDAGFDYRSLDLTDEPAVRKFVSTMRGEGGLDLVVNGAALGVAQPALMSSADGLRNIMATNFVAGAVVVRESARAMMRTGGAIVNLSSIHVPLHSVGSAAYGASKIALEQFSLVLAQELSKSPVTINTLGLSYVAGAGMAESQNEAATQRAQARLARPVPIEVDEILHAIDFFASRSARNITGQTVYFGGPH